MAKYNQTRNPKPTLDNPMPVIINKGAGSTCANRYASKGESGQLMCYYGFLSILRGEDGSVIDTLSRHTRLYTASNGTLNKPDDGMFLPETQESVDLMWKMVMSFPEPVALYSRHTRRLAWKLVGVEEPE